MKQYAPLLLAFLRAFRPEARPYLATVHNNTEDPFAHYLLSHLPFAGVVVLTHRSAHDLPRGGVPRHRLKVLPNMIRVERFEAVGGGRVRRRLGLDDEPIVLFPSRLVGREGDIVYGSVGGKGLDILLRAFPLVLREVPEAKLLLMGNDPIRPELVARAHRSLLDIADAFGFGDALLFLHGPVPQEEVPEVFAASDVVVSPGATEGFGMVFLEGMAAGRPVVGVNSVDNGVPEVVPDGRAGILVPPNDPGSTAKALTSLLLDPEGTAAMGERGLAWVKKRYDASTVLPRLLDTYFECRAEAGRG